ncbi:MAG: Type-I restriction modification system methylase [Pseudomonadota bacterium]|jgi:type I restriction enzyme S subunit
MSKLEIYSSYKDSGIEWLGEIPEHWETKPLKHLLVKIIDNRGRTPIFGDFGIPMLEISNITYGIRTPSKIFSKFVDENIVKYYERDKVKIDDLLISTVGATSGKTVIIKEKPNYFIAQNVVGLRVKINIIPDFLFYVLNSSYFYASLQLINKGNTIDSLKVSIFINNICFIPPKEEQVKIASFLDEKTAKIDEVISQKEKLIELLKEQKQIVINDAVTKSLDKTVEFVDSGVEWIGKIPKHWKVSKVKNIFKLIIEPAPKANAEELLSIYTDIGVKPRKDLEEKGNKASTTDGYWVVKKGDFIVNKLLAWMGAIGLSEYDGVTSPAYDILRAKKDIVGKYYHELFRLKIFSQEMKKYSRGIMDMRLRLYFDKFGDILIPYPSYIEQLQIVEYIEKQTTKIDCTIELQQNYIAKLKEYKASLIDSVVTGKARVA